MIFFLILFKSLISLNKTSKNNIRKLKNKLGKIKKEYFYIKKGFVISLNKISKIENKIKTCNSKQLAKIK